MFRSLRVRLPLLFLAAIALAFLVASLIALRLFQDYTRTQSLVELRREASGLARLYGEAARQSNDDRVKAPNFAAATLEDATGDSLYYIGLNIFPGQEAGLTRVTEVDVGRKLRLSDEDRDVRVRAAR